VSGTIAIVVIAIVKAIFGAEKQTRDYKQPAQDYHDQFNIHDLYNS
jgi:hypothetical protein